MNHMAAMQGGIVMTTAVCKPDAACGSALTRGLQSENFWTRVHAAELLLELGRERELVTARFRSEAAKYDSVFVFRVGVCRVLIRCGDHPEAYLEKLRKIAFAPDDVPDRAHALETLGKLRWHPEDDWCLAALRNTGTLPYLLRIYAAWIDTPGSEAFLLRVLRESRIPTAPYLAASALNLRSGCRSGTLDELECRMNDSGVAPAVRMLAATVLLRAKRIDFGVAEHLHRTLPEKSVAGEWMRLLAEFRPACAAAEWTKYATSEDLELAMLAEWGRGMTEK